MNTIPSLTRSVVAGLALILMSAGAHAKVYRCVVNGNTTYSDRPCEGADSEAVNMVAPSAARAVPVMAKASPATTAASAAAPATAGGAAPSSAPPVKAAAEAKVAAAPTAGGKDWRLAGEYSDRVRNSSKILQRASYGIECNASRRRPFVYAVNGRYSLTIPSHSGNNQLQGPFYDSLDAAATAACAAK